VAHHNIEPWQFTTFVNSSEFALVDATPKGAHNVFGMKYSQQMIRVAVILCHLSTISIQSHQQLFG
jgi:hypothetical protein